MLLLLLLLLLLLVRWQLSKAVALVVVEASR